MLQATTNSVQAMTNQRGFAKIKKSYLYRKYWAVNSETGEWDTEHYSLLTIPYSVKLINYAL